MSITSSVFALESVQADGRRYVTETHSDVQGVVAVVNYLAAADADYQAIANARAIVLNATLADQECAAKLAIDGTPLPLRFQNATQFLARLRAIYRNASREGVARLCIWVTKRIDEGVVTSNQLATAFGLTAPQWATLETKMRNVRADQEVIDAAVGE